MTPGQQGRPKLWRGRRLLPLALGVAIAAGVLGWALAGRARPVLKWSEVLEAVGQRNTMQGRGWLHLRDGTEWRYGLWARMESGGRVITKGMLVPVSAAAARKPTPELVGLCEAMSYCGEEGILRRLAARKGGLPAGRQAGRARGRRIAWAGRRAWELRFDTPKELQEEGRRYPDRWRFVIDPETKLVRRVELFVREDGEERLRGWCDYEYDRPLPPGFEEAPG